MESTYSLQGSFIGPRDSPRPLSRRLDRIPLYLNEESHATLERPYEETVESSDRLAHPPPSQLRSRHTTRTDYPYRVSNVLRESRSLDPFPSQTKKGNDPFADKLKKKSSISLEHGVSDISNDPNGDSKYEDDEDGDKLSNNNCNGSVNIEDPTCPLLLTRQTSLTNENVDELHSMLLADKKWRSLEDARMEADDNQSGGESGSVAHKGSFKSWLKGVFQGNGFKNSNASLKKVTVLPGVKEVPVINESPTQKESIV